MKNHANAGFTLIEIAITLIIIGVLAGAAMPSLIRYKQHASLVQTQENQEAVARSVAAYEVMSGNLPCPADPAATGQRKGVSRTNCNTPQLAIGIVPYRTLGLPEPYAKDGYKRWMTYVIPANDSHENICKLQPRTPLIVKDDHEAEVTNHDNYIVLLLISHGPAGHGAFKEKRAERITLSDASEKEIVNSNETVQFYALPFSLGDPPFRHIVKYVSRHQLRWGYGKRSCPPPEERQDGTNPF